MENYILTLFSLLFLFSCSTNDDESVDRTTKVRLADKVIFGTIHGMCGGDCRDLFLIDGENLYKDADNFSEEYGNWKNTTFKETLEEKDFKRTTALLDVPASMMADDLPQEDLVQKVADVDYYLYIEQDGKSTELIFDHIHKNADPETKAYFKTFLQRYKDLGGFLLDTTNIENYYQSHIALPMK